MPAPDRDRAGVREKNVWEVARNARSWCRVNSGPPSREQATTRLGCHTAPPARFVLLARVFAGIHAPPKALSEVTEGDGTPMTTATAPARLTAHRAPGREDATTMTSRQAPGPGRQASPDGGHDPRFDGISTAALAREVRRRKATRPGRDKRANPISTAPGAAGNAAGKYKENAEFLGVLAQLIRAAAKRIGNNDLALLGQFEEMLATEYRRAVAEACWAMIREGVSWREIGDALGMTKSAAFERCEPYRPADMPKNTPNGTPKEDA